VRTIVGMRVPGPTDPAVSQQLRELREMLDARRADLPTDRPLAKARERWEQIVAEGLRAIRVPREAAGDTSTEKPPQERDDERDCFVALLKEHAGLASFVRGLEPSSVVALSAVLEVRESAETIADTTARVDPGEVAMDAIEEIGGVRRTASSDGMPLAGGSADRPKQGAAPPTSKAPDHVEGNRENARKTDR